MKKLALLVLGLILSVATFAQDTCCYCKGRHTFYISGSVSGSLPPSTYGYSAEIGSWGTTSLTSFGLTGDFLKTLPSDSLSSAKNIIRNTNWLGIKGYYTMFQTRTSSYMVYLAPKISVGSPTAVGLLEIGINPNYEINRHMLLSISFCDQILNNSTWNPGGSVGIVILK